MELIKDLGIKKIGFDKRYNKPSSKRFGLFKCPVCSKEIELAVSRGLSQNTCVECRGTQNVTHGHSGKKYYFVWQAMKDRCYNPKNPKYHIYGGKGVKLEDKWLTFEGFWEDMGSTYEDGLTIDRIDSSKGYCKTNCRWIIKSRNSSETTKRKPVIQLQKSSTPYNYEVVAEWESAQKAAESLGLTPAHITAVCKGQRQTHGGFGWQYKEI